MTGPERQRGRSALRQIAVPLIGLVILFVGYGVYKTLTPPATLAGAGGQLAACPPRPSCVYSGAGEARHRIAPIRVEGDPDDVWREVATALLQMPHLERMSAEGDYMHAVFVSPIVRYRDDLELKLRSDGEIAVRSASRFGYYDFDVNRERVERLRARVRQAGGSAG